MKYGLPKEQIGTSFDTDFDVPLIRAFQGVWFPRELWLNEELTLVEKCIIAEINSLDTYGTGCYASNKHFTKFSGLSEARVAHIVADLIKRKFLERVSFDGRKRYLRVATSSKAALLLSAGQSCHPQQGHRKYQYKIPKEKRNPSGGKKDTEAESRKRFLELEKKKKDFRKRLAKKLRKKK